MSRLSEGSLNRINDKEFLEVLYFQTVPYERILYGPIIAVQSALHVRYITYIFRVLAEEKDKRRKWDFLDVTEVIKYKDVFDRRLNDLIEVCNFQNCLFKYCPFCGLVCVIG